MHYNLQNIIRQMHQEFQLNPPVPENMLQNAGSNSEVKIEEHKPAEDHVVVE